MSVVSVSFEGETVQLRRYSRAQRVCTHVGTYFSAGISHQLLESYRQAGAPQDSVQMPHPLPARQRSSAA